MGFCFLSVTTKIGLVMETLSALSISNEEIDRIVEYSRVIPWRAEFSHSQMSYVGHQAVELLGYPIDMWYEQDFCLRHIHPDDREGVRKRYDECVQDGDEFSVEYRFLASNDQYRWIDDRVRVESSEDGLRTYHGLMFDITARKEAEDETARLRSQLTHILRVSTVSELSTSFVHELNQPLSAIISNAHAAILLLKRDDLDVEEVNAALHDIESDGKRAGDVIHQLRQLMRSSEPSLASIDVNGVIQDVATLVRSDFILQGLMFSLDLAEGLPKSIGDTTLIQQVLLNLLLNASDATQSLDDAERFIRIKTSLYDECSVVVCVSNSGNEIPSEELEHVFDSFYTTKMNGLGLGLSITRSIIEFHHGRIWGSNLSTGGVQFSFTLPIHTIEGA